MKLKEADPKGLVRESYAIEGITLGECRSIFLDWALSLRDGTRTDDAIRCLLAEYCGRIAGHPMDGVLAEGLAAAPAPGRRGGRAGRRGASDGPRAAR